MLYDTYLAVRAQILELANLHGDFMIVALVATVTGVFLYRWLFGR